MDLLEIGKAAKNAAKKLAKTSTDKKNKALLALKANLQAQEKEILEANLGDIQEAKAKGLDEALIDRLSLQGRIKGLISDLEQVIKLPDPVGECIEESKLELIEIKKVRTPIGVLGVIYESRPNVTLDISALSLKSGNAAILRGGSETLRTNKALVKLIQKALIESDLPKDAIQLIESRDRNDVLKMLHLFEYIDLIIPRGGANLHQFCRENSKIPVITGGIGICHLFVDQTADLQKSLNVIFNAKTQRPTVCNALDTLLVHEKVAESFIPQVIELLGAKGVDFKLDEKSLKFSKNKGFKCSPAKREDFATEWLKLTLGIKVVKNIEEAIEHITEYSTGHSDGILSGTQENIKRFLEEIDSAAVYVNASTRFTDGSQFGFGAEVAISTQKLHARGPMGLKELTSYKWIVFGDYSTRK